MLIYEICRGNVNRSFLRFYVARPSFDSKNNFRATPGGFQRLLFDDPTGDTPDLAGAVNRVEGPVQRVGEIDVGLQPFHHLPLLRVVKMAVAPDDPRVKLGGEDHLSPEPGPVLVGLYPHPFPFFNSQALCCLRVDLNHRLRDSLSAGRQGETEAMVDLERSSVCQDEGILLEDTAGRILVFIIRQGMVAVFFEPR